MAYLSWGISAAKKKAGGPKKGRPAKSKRKGDGSGSSSGTSSSSSDSDDNNYDPVRLMENKNPMVRLITYGKVKKMMM